MIETKNRRDSCCGQGCGTDGTCSSPRAQGRGAWGGEERHRRETNEQHNIVDKGHKKKEKDEFNYLTIQTRATISCNTTITHI